MGLGLVGQRALDLFGTARNALDDCLGDDPALSRLKRWPACIETLGLGEDLLPGQAVDRRSCPGGTRKNSAISKSSWVFRASWASFEKISASTRSALMSAIIRLASGWSMTAFPETP